MSFSGAYSMKSLSYSVLAIVAVVMVVLAAGFLWIGAIWAAANLKLGWIEIPVHYRLSFGEEVGGVSYTGSTVVQVTYRRIPNWQTLSQPGGAAFYKGQAGCVKLPDGKMVCLMPGGQSMIFGKLFYSIVETADRLLSVNGSAVGPKQKWRPIDVSNAATVAGSSDVPVEMLPAMIVLDDPADSSSVHVFHPEHPEQALGADSRFLGVRIAVTKDPVSHGIETVLPWLGPEHSLRLGNPDDPFEQENHGYPLYKTYFY
jgi:hypothetical protein